MEFADIENTIIRLLSTSMDWEVFYVHDTFLPEDRINTCKDSTVLLQSMWRTLQWTTCTFKWFHTTRVHSEGFHGTSGVPMKDFAVVNVHFLFGPQHSFKSQKDWTPPLRTLCTTSQCFTYEFWYFHIYQYWLWWTQRQQCAPYEGLIITLSVASD